MMARVKEIEEDNRRRKMMYAERQMDSANLKETLSREYAEAISAATDGYPGGQDQEPQQGPGLCVIGVSQTCYRSERMLSDQQ
jgi:hypothetical protein